MAAPATITVIGAGAWGTALATLAASNGYAVTILARRPEVAETLNRDRLHPRLPGVEIHPAIRATCTPEDIVSAEIVVLAVPAQSLRAVVAQVAPVLRRPITAVIAAKGIEEKTALLMDEVLAQEMPEAVPAVLSGPGFATDVAVGLPTAVTLAAHDTATGERAAACFARPTFRPYLTDDIAGAEIGGSVKNVLSIAAGIVTGRRLGESARAALIARGLAEMTRLGVAMGAQRETFAGLSGLGDLVLTATSARSRNTALGIALAEGRAFGELTGPGAPLAEGMYSAGVVVELAHRKGVDMPLSEAVAAVVAQRLSIDEAIGSLLDRPLGRE